MCTLNLIFDWGGVLGDNNNRYAAKKLSSRYDFDEDELFRELDDRECEYAAIGTEEDTMEYYKYFESKYGIPVDVVKEALNEPPPNETFFYVRDLSKRTGNMYLLSNQLISRTNAMKERFDLTFFNRTFFSCDIGLCKPDKRIFEHVLNEIGSEPEKCLFIDDRESNIISAQELGMKTLLYKDLESLKEDIEKIFEQIIVDAL